MLRRFSRRVTPFVAVVALVLCLFATVALGDVFGTKRGKVYHTFPQDCAAARKIHAENRMTFATEAEAKSAGRRLCKQCENLARKASDKGGSGDTGDERDARPKVKPPPADDKKPPSGTSRRPPVETDGDFDSVPDFAAVSKVMSGGTLVLDNGEHAVLIGVVVPARHQPRSQDAVRFLTEQTRGRSMRLVYEIDSCHDDRRDELGRLTAYMTPSPDGRDLGGELIFQGYAWVDRAVPFARQKEYLRLEDDAWRSGRGIWERGGDGGGETVVTGRHAQCYHAPNCEHVKLMAGVMSLTLDEARGRRLTPCIEFRARR